MLRNSSRFALVLRSSIISLGWMVLTLGCGGAASGPSSQNQNQIEDQIGQYQTLHPLEKWTGYFADSSENNVVIITPGQEPDELQIRGIHLFDQEIVDLGGGNSRQKYSTSWTEAIRLKADPKDSLQFKAEFNFGFKNNRTARIHIKSTEALEVSSLELGYGQTIEHTSVSHFATFYRVPIRVGGAIWKKKNLELSKIYLKKNIQSARCLGSTARVGPSGSISDDLVNALERHDLVCLDTVVSYHKIETPEDLLGKVSFDDLVSYLDSQSISYLASKKLLDESLMNRLIASYFGKLTSTYSWTSPLKILPVEVQGQSSWGSAYAIDTMAFYGDAIRELIKYTKPIPLEKALRASFRIESVVVEEISEALKNLPTSEKTEFLKSNPGAFHSFVIYLSTLDADLKTRTLVARIFLDLGFDFSDDFTDKTPSDRERLITNAFVSGDVRWVRELVQMGMKISSYQIEAARLEIQKTQTFYGQAQSALERLSYKEKIEGLKALIRLYR